MRKLSGFTNWKKEAQQDFLAKSRPRSVSLDKFNRVLWLPPRSICLVKILSLWSGLLDDVEKSRPRRKVIAGWTAPATWSTYDYNVLQYDIMQHSYEYDRVLSSRSARFPYCGQYGIITWNRPHNYEFNVKHRWPPCCEYEMRVASQ